MCRCRARIHRGYYLAKNNIHFIMVTNNTYRLQDIYNAYDLYMYAGLDETKFTEAGRQRG